MSLAEFFGFGGKPAEKKGAPANTASASSEKKPQNKDVLQYSAEDRKEIQEEMGNAVALRLFRNAWNLDLSQKALTVAVLSSTLAIATVAYDFWLTSQPPRTIYFAVTPSGALYRLPPLSTPLLSQAQLMSIVEQWAVQAYTWNYEEWRQQFQQYSQNFSKEAWKSWFSSLNKNGLIAATKKDKWLVSAVPTGAPVIINSGMLDGKYSWRLQIPITANFATDTGSVDKHYIITMVVQRAEPTAYPTGIRIIQMVSQNRNGG